MWNECYDVQLPHYFTNLKNSGKFIAKRLHTAHFCGNKLFVNQKSEPTYDDFFPRLIPCGARIKKACVCVDFQAIRDQTLDQTYYRI